MASAMKAQDMELSKVGFSAPKTLDNGGKMVYVNYNGGINPFYVTTPEAGIFGIQITLEMMGVMMKITIWEVIL